MSESKNEFYGRMYGVNESDEPTPERQTLTEDLGLYGRMYGNSNDDENVDSVVAPRPIERAPENAIDVPRSLQKQRDVSDEQHREIVMLRKTVNRLTAVVRRLESDLQDVYRELDRKVTIR